MSAVNKARRVSRRTVVNVMLYIGVLAMAMVTYYDYRSRNAAIPTIEVFEPEQITALRIHRPGYATMGLQKVAEGWAVVDPIHRAAIHSRVEALLSLAQLDSQSGYGANELNLAELGLGTPQASVHLSAEAGAISVLFGGKGPNDVRRYVQIGTQVWLLDDVFLPLLTGGFGVFVQRDLLPTGKQLSRLKTPNGEIDNSDLLNQWQGANALAVVATAGLSLSDAADVVLTFTDSSVQSLQMARTDEHIALLPEAADYALLLSESQALALGLTEQ